MSERSSIDANREIIAEASAWLAQLESGDLSGADLAAFREWMGRSPAHAKEMRAMAALSRRLSVLTEMAEPLARAASADSGLRRLRARRTFGFAAAASMAMALVIAVGFFFAPTVFIPRAAEPALYETAVGEYRLVRLSDGTTMKLNTDTKIEVDYGDAMRRVQLLKGEAVFNVARNPERPFVVYSGETAAEAIGTSFIVRLRQQVTELSVIEGVVSFAKVVQAAKGKTGGAKPAQGREEIEKPQRERPAVILKAGEALTSAQIPAAPSAEEAVPVAVIAPRELQRKLSWTDGVFDFSDTPLQEVVDEINRYNPMQVEIADAELRAMKFGGIFETSDPEALLEALEELGVRVDRTGDGRILLHSQRSR